MATGFWLCFIVSFASVLGSSFTTHVKTVHSDVKTVHSVSERSCEKTDEYNQQDRIRESVINTCSSVPVILPALSLQSVNKAADAAVLADL